MMPNITKYKVKDKIKETHNVFIWRFVPVEDKIFNYQAGQFALINLFKKNGDLWQKKPYSIASSPLTKDYLEFGIKTQGEFTHKLNELTPGDIVGIEGPYGVFTYEPPTHQDLVMFAGGIGISPFISMIRLATQTAPQNKILLYYCNQTEEDIACQETLNELAAKNKNLKIVYSVDKCLTQNWPCEVGLINEDKIKGVIADFQNKYFFLCGPPPFMKAVSTILTANQVPSAKIKKEIF